MIFVQEFARSLPGSRSRHTESEESLVDDPMENDDIEEVVEPADPNLEPKEILLAKICSILAFFNKPRNNARGFLNGLNRWLL